MSLRPLSDITGALEGTVAGVMVNNTYGQPGSEALFRIRGIGSVNGVNAPLFILDGVVFQGNLSDLNADDIESLTVLKDATSAAMYGNRASNGVILITTKSSRKHKFGLNVNIKQGIYSRGLNNYQTMGANDFMETMWAGYRNSLLTDATGLSPNEAHAEASNGLIEQILGTNIYNAADNALFDNNGKLLPGVKIKNGYAKDRDWIKAATRNGYRQEYGINGGATQAKSSYFFSLNYLDEEGYANNSDFNRISARLKGDISPKQWIKLGMSLHASHQIYNLTEGTNVNSIQNIFNSCAMMAPIYFIHKHDLATGAFLHDNEGNKQYDTGELRDQYTNRNPIYENHLNRDRTQRNTANGMVYTHLYLPYGFSAEIKGDLNVRNSRNTIYYNSVLGEGKDKGILRKIDNNYKNYTFNQILKWQHHYKKNSFDALAGHEYYSYHRDYQFVHKEKETFPNNYELGNFNTIVSVKGYSDNYRTESYFARVNYGYDNTYFVEASFRRDGSSRFHQDYRWGNFGSLGTSWNLSNEAFVRKHKWVDNLRLRASYGQVGNDASAAMYAYMALYNISTHAEQGSVYKNQNEAKELHWEKSNSVDVAIEGRLFNRLNFSVDFYNKLTNDLLFDVTAPLSSGSTSTQEPNTATTRNIGDVINRGIEFSADVDAYRNKNWKWNIGILFSSLYNKVKKLPAENRENGILTQYATSASNTSAISQKIIEDRSMYSWWLYQWAGVDQLTGKSVYKINTDDYYISTPEEGKKAIPQEALVNNNNKNYTTDVYYAKKDWCGSALPKVFGSFNTTLSWKNISLYTLCTFSIGGKIYDVTYQNLMSQTGTPHAMHKNLLKAWTTVPDGMTGDATNRINANGVPVVDYSLSNSNNYSSNQFLVNASYLVIKNISLSYRLAKHHLQKLDIEDLSMSINIENVATFSARKGLNPQQDFTGLCDNMLVTPRIISFGLSVKL